MCAWEWGRWGGRGGLLTGQISPHAKDGLEARLLGDDPVLETVLDVERVREDDGLPVLDSLAVVELA